MSRVDTPQSRCRLGVARADITPPVGIYHRMWGAALHDRATAVHRPLLATALWLAARDGSARQLLLALDHCILDGDEMANLRGQAGQAVALPPEHVLVTLSHTHGSGWMSRARSAFPGGELIGPYLEALARQCAELATQAAANAQSATLVYGVGRCRLAAHRDFWDDIRQQFVCGFNPHAPADDTVMVARASAEEGTILATLVNYACHPTTLAWENTALSPDFVGALRDLVERDTHAPCLFLQGASGDLGPREGFVGDPAAADRNGRQLGYAALSALEALPPPGTTFVYAGPVVSGAVLGTWRHRPLDAATLDRQASMTSLPFTIELPYRLDLPTLADTARHLAHWLAEEEQARQAGDADRLRDCRAHVEQMTRQKTRLDALPPGPAYPYRVTLWRLGDALWVLVPGELYQIFQTTLRQRFPTLAVLVVTQTGDWQPGYLPSASSYGYGIYQETIATVAAGSLELVTEAVARHAERLFAERACDRPDAPARKA